MTARRARKPTIHTAIAEALDLGSVEPLAQWFEHNGSTKVHDLDQQGDTSLCGMLLTTPLFDEKDGQVWRDLVNCLLDQGADPWIGLSPIWKRAEQNVLWTLARLAVAREAAGQPMRCGQTGETVLHAVARHRPLMLANWRAQDDDPWLCPEWLQMGDASGNTPLHALWQGLTARAEEGDVVGDDDTYHAARNLLGVGADPLAVNRAQYSAAEEALLAIDAGADAGGLLDDEVARWQALGEEGRLARSTAPALGQRGRPARI